MMAVLERRWRLSRHTTTGPVATKTGPSANNDNVDGFFIFYFLIRFPESAKAFARMNGFLP
jgi:hypothetical protein